MSMRRLKLLKDEMGWVACRLVPIEMAALVSSTVSPLTAPVWLVGNLWLSGSLGRYLQGFCRNMWPQLAEQCRLPCSAEL